MQENIHFMYTQFKHLEVTIIFVEIYHEPGTVKIETKQQSVETRLIWLCCV